MDGITVDLRTLRFAHLEVSDIHDIYLSNTAADVVDIIECVIEHAIRKDRVEFAEVLRIDR